MASLNPDIRSADDVIVPPNLKEMTGWTDGNTSVKDAIDLELRGFAALQEDMPVAFKTRAPVAIATNLREKWEKFQADRGRYPGSADWSLLDEFVHGKVLGFLPQIIGSCVCSNTFRAYVIRMMYQIMMLGKPEEFFGRSEFGVENYSFYAPFTYGMARRRANMRGGDGLYCKPMVETMMKDGFVLCSNPQLKALTERLGVAGEKDYPEPQSARVYRQFGDWQYLDELKPYADFAVSEMPMVNSADQLWDLLQDGKPAFVCSGEAIHKVGTHPDGFPIHARNPRDVWNHNMAFHGCMVASDGERFLRESNESWHELPVYNRKFDEVDRAFREGRLTCAAIGNINAPASAPPLVA